MTEHFEPVLPLVRAAAIEPAACRRVAFALAEAQDNSIKGMFSVPMAGIAAWTELSKGQARKHVHALLKMGVLIVLANANGGDPGAWPVYQFNAPRLRALAQQSGRTSDLFEATPIPRMSFMAEDEAGERQYMAIELYGRPGQRTVRFFLESPKGDIAYGWTRLQALLLPVLAKGSWTGWLNPETEAPDWALPVFVSPETVEALQQWAQDNALGRIESAAKLKTET